MIKENGFFLFNVFKFVGETFTVTHLLKKIPPTWSKDSQEVSNKILIGLESFRNF